jgi:hypothetical protein
MSEEERQNQLMEKYDIMVPIFDQAVQNGDILNSMPEVTTFMEGWLQQYDPNFDREDYMEVIYDKYNFMRKIYFDSPSIGMVSNFPVMAEAMSMSLTNFLKWLFNSDPNWNLEANLDTFINFDKPGLIESIVNDGTNRVVNIINTNYGKTVYVNNNTRADITPPANKPPGDITPPSQKPPADSGIYDYQGAINDAIASQSKQLDLVGGVIERKYLLYAIAIILLIILALLFI